MVEQPASVGIRRLRIVERFERTVGREPALDAAALAELVERFHAAILAD